MKLTRFLSYRVQYYFSGFWPPTMSSSQLVVDNIITNAAVPNIKAKIEEAENADQNKISYTCL